MVIQVMKGRRRRQETQRRIAGIARILTSALFREGIGRQNKDRIKEDDGMT